MGNHELPFEKLFRLDGRVALVTGAAGYLGNRISNVLAEAGAHVFLNGRSDKAVKLVEKINSRGLKASAAIFDVTDSEAVAMAINRLEIEHGRLDVLINNAYFGKTGTIETAIDDDFRSAYEIAVTAAFRLVQQAKPLLEKAAGINPGGASVINIASMYGMVSPDPAIYGDSGMNNPPFYAAAKGGLIQLTRYLACHLAACKIRVNSISPGPFPPQEIAEKNPVFFKELCRRNPLGRIGEPDELRGPVLLLASDAGSYITGVNLPVDGGWTAW
jgi:NAD(P)-dependent dehydrogenase (short-subunit alcohol dehydrogenase family)